MRYFFLTFQTTFMSNTGNSYLRTQRHYVVRFGKHYVTRLVPDSISNAFHTELPYDFYTRNSHAIYAERNSDADFIDYIKHWCDGYNVHMTEMTAQQRSWFLGANGYAFCDPLFGELYNRLPYTRDRRINAIREARRARLFPKVYGQRSSRSSSHNIVHYKGCDMLASSYIRARHAMRDLAQLVRVAIRDDDGSDVDEFFMDRADNLGGAVNLGKVFKSVIDALDAHNVSLEVVYCDCGHFERSDDIHEVRNDRWCEHCFEEDAVFVEDRDEYWARDDAYWSENHDAYYSYDIDSDEDNNEDADPDTLMEYSTNVLDHISADPKIKPSPHGELLMGIEFEMETQGSTRSAVRDVREQLGENYCVCKYDGSLGGGGLEIVTAPRGLTEHVKRFKDWQIDSAYRAWDRKCCGMHIHIDSRSFTQMTLGKFIMFINDRNNMDFIRKIAGRHPERDEQARSYAASEDQTILINPSKAVKGKSYERYRMVNLQNLARGESRRLGFGDRFEDGNYNTVELRIFRASLKKERLLAQIEFTHAAVMFCRVASWRELNQATFLKWLKGSATGLYPHLSDWYGVRRRVPVCNEGKQSVCEDQPEATTEGD
jgi:hypothetical protein